MPFAEVFMNFLANSKWQIISYVFLMILVGCTGLKYTDKVDPVKLDEKVQKESSRVYAKANEWRNSGVIVQLIISAFCPRSVACWHFMRMDKPVRSRDNSTICPEMFVIVKKWSAGALIGKILGENGEPFGIGYEYLLTPKEEGTFSLFQDKRSLWSHRRQRRLR